ncbi:MAG: ABC transporter permease [Candidatus Omnitrophica bacterium]|nr:ABC transporter permease [Candidatus Omnitrophota bacterium]MBU1925730.1 ABC transporter permease [Candidatus Omnitrophota bacterium]
MTSRIQDNQGRPFSQKGVAQLNLLVGRISSLIKYRRVILQIAVARIKAKYLGLKLGIWISVLNPLLVMLVVSFVFTRIIKLEITNFPLFALSGIFPWLFFTAALSEAAHSIVSQQNLLYQFKLPKEALPLATIIAEFFSFLVGWCIIYPLFIVFNPQTILLLPVLILVLALLFCFIFGLAIVFAALNVISRDTGQLLGVILMFWFWVTPIFYSVDMVPQDFRWISYLNPMTYFTIGFRDLLFHGKMLSLAIIGAMLMFSGVSVFCGLLISAKLDNKILKGI